MFERIGLRTLKTGIAVGLSVIVSNLLNLEYPFFVCMTALISMDKTVLTSIKMGRNRVFGTFLGASVGIIFNYIDAGNPLLCCLGMIIIILILNKLKMQGAIGISGIVFSAMMVHLGDKSPLMYGMHRTLDSFVGASVTLLVNAMILPYYNIDKLKIKLDNFHDMIRIEEKKFIHNEEPNFKHIEALDKDISSFLDLYMNEIMSPNKKHTVLELCAKYNLLKDSITQMQIAYACRDDEVVKAYHTRKMNETFKNYDELLPLAKM